MLAEAVASGARDGGAHVTLIAVDDMTEAQWDTLDGADAVVFGSATYMGNVSAAFQAFAEQTGRRCMNGTWRDKVAAGFTNSGAKAGDKMHTLISLAVFAAQHHMHWVNLGLGAGWNSSAGSEDDLNRLGFWLGGRARPMWTSTRREYIPAMFGRAAISGGASRWSRGSSALVERLHLLQHRRHQPLTVGWMCIVREIAV